MDAIRLVVAEEFVKFLEALFSKEDNLMVTALKPVVAANRVYVGLTEDETHANADRDPRVVVVPGNVASEYATLNNNLESNAFGTNEGIPDNAEHHRDSLASSLTVTCSSASYITCERVGHEVYYALRMYAGELQKRMGLTRISVVALSAAEKKGKSKEFVCTISVKWHTDIVWSFEGVAPTLKATTISFN